MEEQQIIEIWDTFRDFIPEKSRETAASQFVEYLVSQDVEIATLESVLGYDPNVDAAIELVIKEYSDGYDDDEDDEELDEGIEDEDY
jgi:hypothetical protein